MTEHVIVTDADGIRTIRMNRPDKKNALTLAMYEAMTAALEGANADDSVRCVLIAGVPGAFSAGNDLADFLKAAESSGGLNRPALRFLPALVCCNKPMVAAVSGVAVGVGTTMLFHCDFVVAGSDAYFSTPFVSLGLIPEAASSLLAPRLMGQRRAFEFLVMGHPLNATQAKEFGGIGSPSGVRKLSRRPTALFSLGLNPRMPSRISAAFIRLTIRLCSPTRLSRSRLGRLASSSFNVGIATTLQ